MLLLIFKLFSWRIINHALLILILIQLILILLLCLMLLIIFAFYRYLNLTKQINSLIKYQEIYCEKTVALIEVAKLSLFSINYLKNPITSLRLYLKN
jgi:membrane protein implicated in regulation of membrane protease activity